MSETRQICLKSRPEGIPTAENFELRTVSLPPLQDGEVLVRNLFMSVDPYMRGRMRDAPSYTPPFQIGAALEGRAIGEVVESRDPAFRPGDRVRSDYGWREQFTTEGRRLLKLPVTEDIPASAFLGVLGIPGFTAWSGLTQIGKPQDGETIFVSGAAGAVGSVVAQMGKILGCRVIASAGSTEKCDWLTSLGIDHVVNYRTETDLLSAVRAGAPDGINVYFDNVGGKHLEVAIELARPFARFVECGMISAYNATEPVPGPHNIIMVIGKSLRMRGFIVLEFMPLYDQFVTEMTGWIRAGKMQWQETVIAGLENAPEAFIGLFSGRNIGKMVVDLRAG